MIPHISTTQSESGRHTGVIMVSNEQMDYRILNDLCGSFKRATGGGANDSIVISENNSRTAAAN